MSWQKKILRVDLTAGTVTSEPLNLDWANHYLGTRGLGTKYLWEEMDPAADPMGPDNVLIFATGPTDRDDGFNQRTLRGDYQGPVDQCDCLLQLRG